MKTIKTPDRREQPPRNKQLCPTQPSWSGLPLCEGQRKGAASRGFGRRRQNQFRYCLPLRFPSGQFQVFGREGVATQKSSVQRRTSSCQLQAGGKNGSQAAVRKGNCR